jgi:hypothetical protein
MILEPESPRSVTTTGESLIHGRKVEGQMETHERETKYMERTYCLITHSCSHQSSLLIVVLILS